MIENPEDIFGQIQNLDEKIARVSLNHLSRIKLLENEITNHVTASNRHILEVFYTMRTDEGPINGAYDCNGAEYAKTAFDGADNPYDMLVAGKAPTCSYAEYNAILAEKGSCAKFGLNQGTMKFKVPTLTNILQPTVLASAIGEICDAGLPNIKGNLTSFENAFSNAIGAFSISGQNGAANYHSKGGTMMIRDIGFNASSSNAIYGNSTTVQPQTIYTRAMVQLATAGQEISIQQYEQQLSQYAQTAMLNGRLIGEIIQSALPLTDAGVHLLDGSQIQKSGIYAQFCTYVANLQADYPDLFCTEAEFDHSVATYGSCGKFVNGTSYIRLPKVSDILQGTTDLSAVGDLVEAGLPNITGSFYDYHYDNSNSRGVFSEEIENDNHGSFSSGESNRHVKVNFNASLANPIYGNSNTVQPQTIKSLLYICVATRVKTPVEVNIDNVITDLNEIRSVIQNVATRPYVTEEWHEGSNWYRVWSTGFIEQGGRCNRSDFGEDVVNFNAPFTNINSIVVTLGTRTTNFREASINAIKAITTTSMTVLNGTSVTDGCFWHACGF